MAKKYKTTNKHASYTTRVQLKSSVTKIG